MEASAKGDKRDLGGSRSSHSYSSDDTYFSPDESDGAGFFAVSYTEREYRWQLAADMAYSTPFNGAIKRITSFTLTPLAMEDERNYLGVYLGGGAVEFESGSLADVATDDPWMFDIGLTYRRYLNHERTGFSPYITGSLGYELLLWDYRNPIVAGGETITGDQLGGVQGSVGFGVTTRRDSYLSFFGEVGIGATIFCETTGEGFDNDVFDDFGFFTVKAGLSLKF